MSSIPRVLVGSIVVASSLFSGLLPGFAPAPTEAAQCVKFVASNFDAPGDDNYMPQLNSEWVRIKNTCSTGQNISRWRIHDQGAIHTYRFTANFSIGAGKTITLKSGLGTNSSTTRYWQRAYGAVWNNTGDKAYLKNSGGSLVHTWAG